MSSQSFKFTAEIEVELLHIRDKRRLLTARQPDWNIVQIVSRRPDSNTADILRQWEFNEEIDNLTIPQSNATNKAAAKQLYNDLKYKFSVKSRRAS